MMANGDDDPRVYQALALPSKALENGGAEIMRLGIINDELYVSALPAFKNPAQWGEVLAEAARSLAAIYAAQNSGRSKKDVTVQIAEAFAADMGARPIQPSAQRRTTKTKPRGNSKPPKARTTARRRKR